MLKKMVFLGKYLKFVKGEERMYETIGFERGEVPGLQPFGSLVILEDDFIREVDFLNW